MTFVFCLTKLIALTGALFCDNTILEVYLKLTTFYFVTLDNYYYSITIIVTITKLKSFSLGSLFSLALYFHFVCYFFCVHYLNYTHYFQWAFFVFFMRLIACIRFTSSTNFTYAGADMPSKMSLFVCCCWMMSALI